MFDFCVQPEMLDILFKKIKKAPLRIQKLKFLSYMDPDCSTKFR